MKFRMAAAAASRPSGSTGCVPESSKMHYFPPEKDFVGQNKFLKFRPILKIAQKSVLKWFSDLKLRSNQMSSLGYPRRGSEL